MTKYLYGASVQGIQDFIFATNGLKDIIGASEIVETIASTFSDEFEKNCEIIQKAAGNIKLLFSNENDVKNITKNFPKKVMQEAYGISISQAVVSFEGELTKKHLDILEERLKISRNKPSIPLDSNINIIKLSPTTGRSTYSYDKTKKEFIDYATYTKRNNDAKKLIAKLTDDENIEFPKELSQISNDRNKIAIIHADGNGLGKLLQSLSNKLKENNTKIQDVFSRFSTSLDDATKYATQNAYKQINNPKKFRPIILGGDDLSLICSADFALEFTKSFLKEFEEQTKENLKWLVDDYGIDICKNGLTACAGVVFCNEKYPFHYGINLAEELCNYAKKQSKKINKNLAPSSLMFHNIQSSYYVSYDEYIKLELEFDNISFVCGPYFLNNNYGVTIESFLDLVYCLNSDNSPKSRLRKWLSELHFDQTYAGSLLKRINQVIDKNAKKATNNALEKLDKKLSLDNLFIKKDGKQITPIHDAIDIASITGENKCKSI